MMPIHDALTAACLQAGQRVRLRDPASAPVIGAAVGVVQGHMASGRLKVEFETVRWHGRALVSILTDEEVEREE